MEVSTRAGALVIAISALIAGCEAKTSHGSMEDPDGGTPQDSMPIPPGSLCVAQSGSRLKAVYYESPDGTRQFVEWFDQAKNLNCRFVRTPDQKTHCMPTDTLQSFSYFSDANCTVEIAYGGATRPTCTPKLLALPSGMSSPDPLARTVRNRAILGPGGQQGNTAYVKEDGVCAKVFIADGWYYPLSKEVTYDEFVEATLDDGSDSNAAGTSRLRVARFTAADGAVQNCQKTTPFGESTILSSRFYDAERKEVCTLDVAADGKKRCLPPSWLTSSATGPFADAACTQPTYSNAAPYFSSRLANVSLPSDCRAATRYYKRGAPVTENTYVVDSAMNCVVNPFATTMPLYARGPEIPPADFTELTLRPVAGAAGRLRPYVYSGNGTNIFLGNYEDTQQNTFCRFGKTSDGKLRCIPVLPYAINFVDRYTDAACATAPIKAGIGPAACASAEIKSFWRQGACEGASGTAVSQRQGPLYQRAGTKCQLDTSGSYLQLGGEMDPSELVEGQIVIR